MRYLTFNRILVLILILLLLSLNSMGSATNSDTPSAHTRQATPTHPMFRGGYDRLGVYNVKSPDYGILIWNYTTGNQVQSSPIFYANRIYFGSDDANVYCLNAENGKKLWNYTTKNQVQSTPAIFEDRLYIGSMDSSLYCLDAGSGGLNWQYKTEGPVVTSPLVVNNTVFIGSYGGDIYAVHANNGTLKWRFETDRDIWASPAYADSCIYIGSLDGNMYSLWAENGTKRWNFTSITDKWEKELYSTCAISDGKLYFGSQDSNVYCLDIASGELVWYHTTEGYLYSSPAIHNGVVFIGGLGQPPNGKLYALPAEDPNTDGVIDPEEVVWTTPTYDIDGGSSPIVMDGKVIVGSNYKDIGGKGMVFCFDELTGQELWNYTTGGDIHSSPVCTINKIFIGSMDNNMYCIGSTEKPLIEISSSHSLDGNVLQAGKAIDITFTATSYGQPVDGAWYTFETTGGELSATYGTAFADGTQKISFTAPLVTTNQTVKIKANAVKVGYENGTHELEFDIEPLSKSDSESDEWREFFEDVFEPQNQGYCLAVFLLIVINLIIFVLILRKRKKIKSGK